MIGQDEAVETIVERIAMLKAGLNDPGKPIGVFLFAGPTGTGKTELAKAVAEYLFGSVERLIRLDMSEFQTPDSIGKILGNPSAPADTDSLINRVRKQPFSVLLLDEFEKSNHNIWDLFLQVFDDGRLTDAAGQVVDFRHCLIILTSNLGATAHRTLGLGFSPQADLFTSEQIMRAISQTYRPEFQNRLDKVIVFRPLTRELMRGILRKELSALLDRRGFRDRDLGGRMGILRARVPAGARASRPRWARARSSARSISTWSHRSRRSSWRSAFRKATSSCSCAATARRSRRSSSIPTAMALPPMCAGPSRPRHRPRSPR